MKFKYLIIIIILLLACFLCGSVYASDTNSTDLNAQDADSIMSVDQSVESEDVNADNIVLQNTTGMLSSEGDDELGDDVVKNIYFDASVNKEGNGSDDNPYRLFRGEYIEDNSILHFAKGEYLFTLESYDMDAVVFNNVKIIGEGSEDTVIDFYNTQLCTLSLKGDSSVSNIKLDTFCFDGDDLTFYNVVVNASQASGTSYFYYSKFIGGVGVFSADGGGAIYSSNDKTTIGVYHCSFINNTGELGGAINMEGGLLHVYDCLFVNNTAGYGGVIYMSNNANLFIDNCSFINNTADFYGGAVACEKVDYVQINNTDFKDNTAVNNAGGVLYIVNSYYAYVENTNITNSNALMGAAITSLNSNLTVSRSNFKKNNADYYGGALYIGFGEIEITDCSFIDNTALYGGALLIDNATSRIAQSSFINNSASLGGAIYSFRSNATYENNELDVKDLYEISSLNLTICNDGEYPVFTYNPTDYDTLPDSYDLRDYGWLSPVKNQINNGNCWAFTAMAVLESCILKAGNVTYDFSEENMKNLMALFSEYGLYSLTNEGGSMEMAVGYLTSWLGPVLDESDPYGYNTLLSPLLQNVFHVQNVVFLKRDNFTDNDMIKDAILKYGAVGTNMFYHDYFLNEETYAYYCNDNYGGNHAITIVGWDDNYSASNFWLTPEDDGAWIVRNSWGDDWGDNGYFYVSYYDKMFAPVGEEESAYTILLNDTIKYDKVYQYDLTKFGYGWYVNITTLTFYNIFNIESDEYLAAVSTYFNDKYKYKVEISVNNNVKGTQEGIADYGYYTVHLNNLITLKKGDKLKVSFTLTNLNGKNASYPYVKNSNHAKNNIIAPGISFIDINNGVDLYNEGSVACIKAFTVTALPVTLNVPDMKFTYGGSGSVEVTTNASSIIAEVINQSGAHIDINGKTIIITGLDAGNYTLSVTTNDTSYQRKTVTSNIIVNKADSSLVDMTSFEFVYGTSGSVNVSYDNATGVTAFVIGHTEAIVTVGNGIITVSNLNVGDYTLNVTTVVGNNYNCVSKTVDFTVIKANSTLEDMAEFEFAYGSSGTVNVVYTGAENVEAFVVGYTARVVVGDKIITVSDLGVGNYALNVSTVVDNNHNRVSKTVNFTVTKADSILNDIQPFSFDYGSPYNLKVSFEKAEGVNAFVVNHNEAGVDVNGNIITISNLDAGDYTLNVTTLVDENHNNVSKTVDFTVNKLNIDLFILDNTTGKQMSSVTYDFGKCSPALYIVTALQNEKLYNYIIKFDGFSDNVIPADNGVFYLRNLTAGTHQLYVEFNDTNRRAAKTFNIEIVKGKTGLEIPSLTLVYGESGSVVANTIASGVMLVSDEGSFIRVDGKKITVLGGISSGTHEYNFVVNDTNWMSDKAVLKVTVNKANSTLKDIDSSEFKYGDEGKVSVKVSFTDALGVKAYVVGHNEAIVSINGNEITISNLKTDDYTLNVTTVVDGNHNSVSKLAQFSAKEYYKPDINIPKIDPGKSSSVPVFVGKGAGGSLSLIVDGNVLGNFAVDDGYATVNIPKLSAGKHVISIAYSGDENYSSFKMDNSVDVVSLAKITGDDLTCYYLDGSVYKVRVFGEDGNPLAGASVSFKVDGKTVAGLRTDNNGYASYNVVQTPKTYSITCEVNGLKLTRKLTVKQVISAKKTTNVKKSKKVTKIKITLKGKTAYKNKKLTVKFNGKKYNVKTNSKGVAQFKVTKKMVKKFKKGKKVKYTITYIADSITCYVKIK